MPTSRRIKQKMVRHSWIRRMFEEGARLKQALGPDKVFDFTLGNPVVEPPANLGRVLQEVAADDEPGAHRYMHNTGFPWVREAVARQLGEVHGRTFGAEHVVMTCGAAGALNITLKSLLDPGDEVLVLVPFFPEYEFYIDNHAGKMVLVETRADFSIDLDAVRAALTPRTRAMIINSPNNPTGTIYDEATLKGLGELLREAEGSSGRRIYLISDEPYRALVYGDTPPPSIFDVHPHSVLCTSHSKDLALPGERIGFAAIHPDDAEGKHLYSALAFTNRILGFVNAPALMQRVVAKLQGQTVDPGIYRRRRDLLVAGLREAGLEVSPPPGAFYVFPRTPIPDDVEFTNLLKEQAVLVVPGRGFGRPGHVRIAYCIPEHTIKAGVARLAMVMATL